MKITQIAVYKIILPLRDAFNLSGGRTISSLDSTIVSIKTDDGIVGWGECCPFGSSYLPAYAEGVRAGIAELAPLLINQNPIHIDKINFIMDKGLPGHPYVKTAVDIACWDILGKFTNLSVCELLGGRFGEGIDILAGIGLAAPEAAVEKIAKYRAKGYRKFSCKCSGDPKTDIPRMHRIMEKAQDGEDYTFDANKGYTRTDALRVIRSAQDLDVIFEQPCATYEECLSVQRRTSHPILLDEIFDSMDTLIRVLSDRSAEAVCIKISKVGGLSKGRRIRDVCITSGTMMTIQDTGGSQISGAAVLHFAQSIPEHFRHSIWVPGVDDASADISTADGIGEIIEGRLSAPTGPGLGLDVHMDVIGNPVAIYE